MWVTIIIIGRMRWCSCTSLCYKKLLLCTLTTNSVRHDLFILQIIVRCKWSIVFTVAKSACLLFRFFLSFVFLLWVFLSVTSILRSTFARLFFVSYPCSSNLSQTGEFLNYLCIWTYSGQYSLITIQSIKYFYC